jgi:nickel transport protein
MKASILLLLAALFAFSPARQPAWAHGTNYNILDSASAIVVEFVYSDNQPIRYAEVLVFSPENEKIEYQNGRTDMNGRFAFFPQAPGEWRIQADDGTGHLQRVTVQIAPDDGGEANSKSISGHFNAESGDDHHHHGLPRTWGIILGISLIANIFLGFYIFKARRS